MITLDKDVRRLIVEAGLAASNHRLSAEAKAIQAALRYLIDDAKSRRIVDAAMLIGLGKAASALELLRGDVSEEAEVLRRLVDNRHSKQPARPSPPFRLAV